MVGLPRQLRSVIKGENSSTSVGDTDSSNKTCRCEVEKHFIGMEEDTDLLESLVRGDEISDRVISICGMEGIGKPTLITNTYRGAAPAAAVPMMDKQGGFVISG